MKRIGILLVAFLLAACAKSSDPGEPVERFLKAMLAGDQDKAISLACPDWEAQAAVEVDAFSGVSARLDGVQCKKSGSESAYTLVHCTGRIVLDYNGESRDRSLDGITYQVKKIDGEWKLCGYQ